MGPGVTFVLPVCAQVCGICGTICFAVLTGRERTADISLRVCASYIIAHLPFFILGSVTSQTQLLISAALPPLV